MQKRALVLIDYLEDIVGHSGVLTEDGYGAFNAQYNTVKNAQKALNFFRKSGDLIIHINMHFKEDLSDAPKNSPLVTSGRKALISGTKGAEFIPEMMPEEGEVVITKKRVNPFYQTNLENILHQHHITDVYFAGISTELAVDVVARDANDMDFSVYVLDDASAAATREDHDRSLAFLKRIATILNVDDL